MIHAYRLSSLKLVSDIELPELMPWGGWREAPAELFFRLGKVPRRLEAPTCRLRGRTPPGDGAR